MPKQLYILYISLYVAMIGYGISLPVLPFFLQNLADYRNISPAETSLHIGGVTAIFAFGQMIFAPLWGKLSDSIGKRKVLMILGLAGYAVSMALTGLGESLGVLYGARMLNGAFAAAVLPIASAYIIDVSPEKTKARGLAWHGTAVGLGVVTGPALGAFLGILVKKHPVHLDFIDLNSFSTPFFLASLLAVFALLLAAFWLPESSPGKKNPGAINADGTSGNENTTIIKSSIAAYLLLAMISQFALSLFEGTFVLHAQQSMQFNAAQLGSVFMVCGFVMAIAQGTTVAGLIERFGAKRILPFGFLFMGAALLALMFTYRINQILILVGLLAMGMAVITPSVTLLISQGAQNRLGKTLGLLTGANSIGQTIGPLAGSMLFVYNIHLPYLLTTGLLFLAASSCLFKKTLQRHFNT